jgi:UDP-glucose 4-epimerase
LGKVGHELKVIGTRHGEKLYEVLLSREEMAFAEDTGHYYRIPPDLRDLNYSKFIDNGKASISSAVEYTSHNTNRLNIQGMKELLLELDIMQSLTQSDLNISEI